MKVYLYILKCSDNTYYTGISANLQLRFLQHLKGRVSYTRYRLPVSLIHTEEHINRKNAAKKERRVKNLGAKKYLIKMYGSLYDKVTL